jgi:hypothetical protein
VNLQSPTDQLANVADGVSPNEAPVTAANTAGRPANRPKRKAPKLALSTLIPLSLFWLSVGFWIGATVAR